jgi:tetratricopeptide (TPR) repeat protein
MDFLKAQFFFRKACKESKSYQAYNNLGIYYIKNGIICKNNKNISGEFIGKKMIEKSLSIHETSIALNNLAALEYDNKNFESELKYWQHSYKLTESNNILYNISSAYYRLKKYEKALQICEKIRKDVPCASVLYAFSFMMCYPTECVEVLRKNSELIKNLDLSDQIKFFYQLQIYEKVPKLYLEIVETPNIGIGEGELPMILDSYIRCKTLKDGLKIIKADQLDGMDETYKRSLQYKISRMIKDEKYRDKEISEVLFSPDIIHEGCGYFGCDLHKTPWDL